MTFFGRPIPAWTVRLAQAIIAASLPAVLWRAFDGPEAARSLLSADISWLAAAFLALTAQTVLSAMRWRLTAAQFGIALARGHALREYYLAQVVNQALPGGMVGDAGRAVRARDQAGLLASGQAVAFERLAGQIAMFLALTGGFFVTFAAPGGFEWPPTLAAPVALLILVGTALPLVLYGARHLPGAAGRSATVIWNAIHKALTAPTVLPGQVVLSAGTAACTLGAFAFCAEAVGVDLNLAAIFGLVPLILFTMLIPITISGWGLREGAAAALFPLAGATPSAGLATSIAFGLVFLATVLPGLFFMRANSTDRTLKP
ncbi:MAG: lysylphosphatidylglycerol synthase transmembrane domain-containing protein [Roseicyclus sp.]